MVTQSILHEEHQSTLEEQESNRIKFEKSQRKFCWRPELDNWTSRIPPMLHGLSKKTAEDRWEQSKHLIATIKQRYNQNVE